jgi:hypothetical protein
MDRTVKKPECETVMNGTAEEGGKTYGDIQLE